MLSKEDYLAYLKQMIDIENKMQRIYWDLEEKTNDKPLKAIFSKLTDDEAGHAKAVDVLVNLIKQKYPEQNNK